MIAKLRIALKTYGYKGVIIHAFYYINTRIFYKNARLIRLPIEIRGREFIDFGNKLTTGKNCRIEVTVHAIDYLKKQRIISFGNNVIINDNVHIAAKYSVKIGNNVLLASKVFISDHNHGNYSGSEEHSSPIVPPNDRPLFGKEIIIEDDVWLGEFVVVLPGVTIGKGCIIGAMAVVNKSIPPYSIAVGIPAKVIKSYNMATNRWEGIK
jgi:lipopolysaccharide O-acetyltransferase